MKDLLNRKENKAKAVQSFHICLAVWFTTQGPGGSEFKLYHLKEALIFLILSWLTNGHNKML